MIYIPEKYIYFVGGIETKSVEYYDLSKNIFCQECSLNEARCETTLCCINSDYLYAFYGYNITLQNDSDTIEMMPIKKKIRNWEIITIKNNGIKIESRWFGVTLLTDSQALILGGIDVTKDHKDVDIENKKYYNFSEKVYVFDYKQNEINIYQEKMNLEFFFGEKFSYPISDEKFFVFPINEAYVGFISSGNQIQQINYEEKENKVFEQIQDLSK